MRLGMAAGNMKKIPTIFNRNPENMRELTDKPHPDCLWVFNGEGVATRKYDGTACLIKNGKLYRRREIKNGKNVPDNFIAVDRDENDRKLFGWMPVDENAKDDKWHIQALEPLSDYSDGTYELVGPKIQGNKEKMAFNILIKHSYAEVYDIKDRSKEGLIAFLTEIDIEGIVFHHPDGRMAKIKKRDFGLKR